MTQDRLTIMGSTSDKQIVLESFYANNDADMCISLLGREPRPCALCPTRAPCLPGSGTQSVSHRASHGDPSGQL